MLRSLTAPEWYELKVFEELYPSGEDLMDERFALLAEVIAAGMTVKLGEKAESTLSRSQFLKALRGEQESNSPAPEEQQPQTLEQQMLYIDSWISGSNARFRQKQKRLERANKRTAERLKAQKEREARRLQNERPS